MSRRVVVTGTWCGKPCCKDVIRSGIHYVRANRGSAALNLLILQIIRKNCRGNKGHRFFRYCRAKEINRHRSKHTFCAFLPRKQVIRDSGLDLNTERSGPHRNDHRFGDRRPENPGNRARQVAFPWPGSGVAISGPHDDHRHGGRPGVR